MTATTTSAETDRAALQSAVRALLADQSSDSRVRAAIAEGAGPDTALWDQVAAMGVLELASATDRRAAGASVLDLVVFFEELGRSLAVVPALSTAVAIAALDGAVAAESAVWAEGLASGRRRVGVALGVDEDLVTGSGALRAERSDDSFVVHGLTTGVPDAPGADAILTPAATDSGTALFLVPVDPVTVTVAAVPALDLTRPLADVRFDRSAALLVTADADVVARVLLLGQLLQAAEQVGLAQRALDEAVGYAKLRRQFDREIGSFQAIKHSCVDMLVRVEGGRNLVKAAAGALDTDDDAALHVSLAAAYAGEAAIECAERALQVHGGIGYTWEHVCHLIMRRARSGSVRFGTPTAHWQAVTRGLVRMNERRTAGSPAGNG